MRRQNDLGLCGHLLATDGAFCEATKIQNEISGIVPFEL